MTAFDNIKTNNWPATSNNFEDFLVLKLPLNDSASLTESLPVVAGSKVLFPKQTLTNTGVSALQSGDEVYARVRATMTNEKNDSVDSLDNLFDGNLSTTCASTNGTDGTITFSPAITGITSLRIHCQGKPGNGYFVVNGTEDYGSSLGDGVYQWVTISNVTSLSTIFIRHITGNTKTTVQAIEVNGTVLVDPAGGLKKHYDNNAVFNGSTHNLITETTAGNSFLSQDYTIECYINRSGDGAMTGFETFFDTRITDTTAMPVFGINSSGQIKSYGFPSGTGDLTHGSSGAITNGTWHHFAVSKQGSTHRIFLDGTQIYSATSSNVPTVSTARYTIGRTTSAVGPNYAFNGKIQDVRVYKGVAKYTSNFTPPSAILG